jgi:hypothetical protein
MSLKKTQSWSLPIKLRSHANLNEHWRRKVKRKGEHNSIIDWQFFLDPLDISVPCKITLIRVAPRKLDYDNLVYSFKNILDKIGKMLMPEKKIGHADGSGLIEVDYEQQKGDVREYKVIINMEQK